MRILVVSNLYPPVARGGYEVECSVVVDGLRAEHDVRVLTSSRERERAGDDASVQRSLALLAPNHRGAMRAPSAALQAVAIARGALAWRPDLVYVWNGSSLPQAALRVFADSGVPLAFRVCEHWFGALFSGDQFLRELIVAERRPGRALWARGCRMVNSLPRMRLQPLRPLRAAISWNAHTLRSMVAVPSFVSPVLERVGHSVPPRGDLYASVVRAPAPTPEILFVGRVTPYKGLAVAIEALAALRAEHGLRATLVVVGPEDKGHGAQMRKLARRLGVAEDIRWRGQQDPQEIAGAYARAQALIVPSVWDEPFPLVTIEGALARVPVVAADVGGIAEGMHDGEHALLFARGDAAMAAGALASTMRDTEQTAARVERARAAAERFRLPQYLAEQQRFVADALAALRGERAGKDSVASTLRG